MFHNGRSRPTEKAFRRAGKKGKRAEANMGSEWSGVVLSKAKIKRRRREEFRCPDHTLRSEAKLI